MAGDYLTSTQSICRTCRRLITARVFLREDGVWFEKHCPEHGVQEVRVYSDAQAYLNLGHFHRKASVPLSLRTESTRVPGFVRVVSGTRAACLPANH